MQDKSLNYKAKTSIGYSLSLFVLVLSVLWLILPKYYEYSLFFQILTLNFTFVYWVQAFMFVLVDCLFIALFLDFELRLQDFKTIRRNKTSKIDYTQLITIGVVSFICYAIIVVIIGRSDLLLFCVIKGLVNLALALIYLRYLQYNYVFHVLIAIVLNLIVNSMV